MREEVASLGLIRRLNYFLWKSRAKDIYSRLKPYLKKGDKILDIGAGSCQIAEILTKRGFKTTLLDVKNLSSVSSINPIIYDGQYIPFKNNSFDVALLITVLHHTSNTEQVLSEAKRVSKRIIVIEDIYKTTFQKYLTFIMDSLANLEFINHPHSNKSDKEWKRLFKELGLKLVDTKKYLFWKWFISGIYYLKK